MALGRGRSGARLGATLRRGGSLRSFLRPRGFWTVENQRPLAVADPDKAMHLIQTEGLPQPHAIQDGWITWKEWKNLVPRLALPSRRELEALLSGGGLRWREAYENLVVNAGLDYLLDIGLSGGTQITTWYVGLVDSSTTYAAADTMSSHSGWTEFTSYDEAARQTWTDGGVSSQSVDNSASKATFTISANSSTIEGAFLVSNSTKSGTTGTLYAEGDFSSTKNADDNDVLEVTATFTTADDGA